METQFPEPEPTLGEVCETIWALRQPLTGGLAETMVQHTHDAEQRRQHRTCPTGACLLSARAPVRRTVETMVGAVEWERPSFSCRVCRRGNSPLDDGLGVRAGRLQREVHQAATPRVTE